MSKVMTIKIFINGKIWQWDTSELQVNQKNTIEKREWCEWMIVSNDGKIVDIGINSPPDLEKNRLDPEIEIIDLNGALVLPGLHDSHIHALYMGESSEYLDLTGVSSFEEFSTRLTTYNTKYPSKPWIVGFGWEQDRLSSDARYPAREDIDTIVSDRPVLLYRACWHIAVVNTMALQIAGIDPSQITPHNINAGTIDIDEKGATGIVRETAVHLVEKHITEDTEEARMKYIKFALAKCASYGLTAIHTNDTKAWDLYLKLQDENPQGLPLRVFFVTNIHELGLPNTPEQGKTIGRLSCNRMKLFADGSLGAETAALRQPYCNTQNSGMLMHTDDELLQKVQAANAAGYRLEIHAIGDRAAEQVLKILQMAEISQSSRPILTHCQILGKDLIHAMTQQGVLANIQPSFTVTDAAIVKKRLPESMLRYSYCWKTMMENHVICCGGSDGPIETCNPFQGIYDAMFRDHKRATDEGTEVFLPNERLTFTEALKMYTINNAYACGMENQLGQLRVGYHADFVVLRSNETLHIDSNTEDLIQSVYMDGQKTYEYNEITRGDGVLTSYDFRSSLFPGKNGRIRKCNCCR